MPKVKLLEGGEAVDDRGRLRFVGEGVLPNIKRFYIVENFSTETVRAWHGHVKETKFVYAVSGSAVVATVALTDTRQPSKKRRPKRHVLSSHTSSLLQIPAGYAHGWRALEPKTALMFLSTATLKESQVDDYRYSFDYWGEDIWEIENR